MAHDGTRWHMDKAVPAASSASLFLLADESRTTWCFRLSEIRFDWSNALSIACPGTQGAMVSMVLNVNWCYQVLLGKEVL